MTLKTLSLDTGQAPDSASRNRNALVEKGWLLPVDGGSRGKQGRFGTPHFRAVIGSSRTAKLQHGVIPARQETGQPYGKNTGSRTAKLQHEVDVLEVDVSEEPEVACATSVRERDSRFGAVKDFYCSEFEKRNPGVKPPFDGGDGKSLSRLLTQQATATAETIVLWLNNAFDSDDVPPIRRGFRLRLFCSHATEFAAGPLRRNPYRDRPANIDTGDPAKFNEVII
jgi:hypothetical protein